MFKPKKPIFTWLELVKNTTTTFRKYSFSFLLELLSSVPYLGIEIATKKQSSRTLPATSSIAYPAMSLTSCFHKNEILRIEV